MGIIKRMVQAWLNDGQLIGVVGRDGVDYDQADLRIAITPADNGKIIDVWVNQVPQSTATGKRLMAGQRDRIRRIVPEDADIMAEIQAAVVTARLSNG